MSGPRNRMGRAEWVWLAFYLAGAVAAYRWGTGEWPWPTTTRWA